MKKLLFMATCIGMLLAACSDDTTDNPNDKPDPNKPDPTVKEQAKDFMKDQRKEIVQVFEVNTSELPKEFALEGGIKITVPDAFTKDGQPVTGDLTIEFIEVMKPSSAIFSGTNTNYIGGIYANPSYFISQGYFNIDVKQNGQNVDRQLAAGNYLSVFVPNDDTDLYDTQIWMGNEDVNDQFGWEDPDLKDLEEDQTAGTNRCGNTVWKGADGFEFKFAKLGWCNCDIFWNESNMTTVQVALTGNVGELATFMGYSGDTFVFFKPKGHLSICQLYTIVEGATNTVASYNNSMPVGHEGLMIAFSIFDGKFSLAVKDITIEEDMHLTMDLKEVSKEYLLDAIKSLDVK